MLVGFRIGAREAHGAGVGFGAGWRIDRLASVHWLILTPPVAFLVILEAGATDRFWASFVVVGMGSADPASTIERSGMHLRM